MITRACGGTEVTNKRRRHSEHFKFKVALEAVKGLKSISEIASEYNLRSNQVSTWKKQLLAEGSAVFSSNMARLLRYQEARKTELYEQIGQFKMEHEWLKIVALFE